MVHVFKRNRHYLPLFLLAYLVLIRFALTNSTLIISVWGAEHLHSKRRNCRISLGYSHNGNDI